MLVQVVAAGMVCIDLAGQPLKYDEMEVFSSAVAKHTSIRLELHLDHGRGYRRAGAADVAPDEPWRRPYVTGSNHLQDVTTVKASDEHYDAKLFPVSIRIRISLNLVCVT